MNNKLKQLNKKIIKCRKCPRLINFIKKISTEKRKQNINETYWGKPVPGFGKTNSKLLILGLAPAAHGGTRTGRPFTGDKSSDFLFSCLKKANISNLPYSKSKDAIEWLAQNSFSHGVIMVQKEFAEKLLATSKNRRAVSIIATYTLNIKKISVVGKNNFSPPPKVDSVILKISKKTTLDKKLISLWFLLSRIFRNFVKPNKVITKSKKSMNKPLLGSLANA